jgi:multidrug efflux system membrane fusion protein
LLLVSVASATLPGCEQARSQPQAAAAQGAPVTAATVIERQITESQQFSGRLESIERVEIRARVPGFIDKVNFKPGTLVRKGQVLFLIDPRPYAAAAHGAEAAARAAQARADLARLELTRAEKLLADKAIAQREYDERAAAQKELDANVHAAQAQLETARLNLSYTSVLAPIDGRVGKAEITLGNLVDSSAVLTSMVSEEEIYASFDGDEDTYQRIVARRRISAPVRVRVGLAGETGFPHEGELEFIDNRLDPATGAVRLRAVLPNADHLLTPGLYARVEVEGGSRNGAHTRAILISDRAVGTDQSRKFVIVPDNKAQFREVTLGDTIGGLRVVRGGLKAGERIVINGLQRARPGDLLAPHMATMDADPATASAVSPAARLADAGKEQ